MDQVDQSKVVRKFLLSLWGMATLILLFSVIFLAYELLVSDPATPSFGGNRISFQSGGRSVEGSGAFRRVKIYFADQQSIALVPEFRQIELTESTVANCRKVLEELIQGPREILAPIIAPSTQIRGIYLMDTGELLIDFSRDVEAGMIESASAELLMIQGIAASLTQISLRGETGPSVKKIRFLFEGSLPQGTFPLHVTLEELVTPDTSLIRMPGLSSKDA